jgi:hypothetical protein
MNYSKTHLRSPRFNKISCLRSQDKKAPKSSHLINITCCLFNTFPHKKISCLRSNKSDDKTIFFTHLIHSLFQNLKELPQVSIHSISKMQHSNGAVSSQRLISKVISPTFHTGEWRNLTADTGVLYFFRDAQTVVSPHYLVSHDNRKIVSCSWKLILAVL